TGRPLVAYIHRIEMKIGNKVFTARVGFAMRENIAYLLGRMDVLEYFDIRFESDRVCFVEKE
ncbi:MAG: hypothetical protein ACE5OR_16275, partial [bacterium]